MDSPNNTRHDPQEMHAKGSKSTLQAMSRSVFRLAVLALACGLRVHPLAAQTDVSRVQTFDEWTYSHRIDAFTDEILAVMASTQDRRRGARLELACDAQNGPTIRLSSSSLVRNDRATYQVRWDDLPPSDGRTIRFWNLNPDDTVRDDFPNSLYFPSREWHRMLDALGEHQRLRIRFGDREMMDFSLNGFSEAFQNLDCFDETRVAELAAADSVLLQTRLTPPEPTFTVAPSLLNPEEVREALGRAYPRELSDRGIGGRVEVYLFIDENGQVQDARIGLSSFYQALDDAALSIADVFRFSPGLNGDERTSGWVNFPATFNP